MNTPRSPRSFLFVGSVLALLSKSFVVNAQVVLEPRWSEESPGRPANLPLAVETIKVRIDQQYATTALAQEYVNNETSTVEGVCSIRAGQGTRVQGFAYYNGKSKIVGEVFEKEAARAVYEETTQLKRDPGLLEETGEGAFTFRVFPITVNERKRIEVTLGQRLTRRGKHVEYRMPLASSDARISVEMTDPRKLTNFTSSTHRIGVQMSEARTLVTATPLNKKNKEFVLGYDIDEAPFTLSAVIHKDPGQPAYLAIAMGTDSTVVTRTSKDVTIVLDHSGSMDGAPLHEARAAAKEIVSRLTTNDRLNILAFDDRVDSLFPQLEKVTEKSRTAALRYLDQIQSGGGTDIGFALERALSTQRANAERPLVLLLTDGESDAARVFAVAEKDQSPVRIFTVGLGAGVNRPLLSRLSDMKRGKFTYIQSTEAIRSSVERLFDLVETSVLSAPELVLEQGRLVKMHPTTLPDLATGEELFITARAQGTGPVKLVLKGKGIDGPISREIRFDLGNQAIHPWVGRSWAENRVDRLLEDISLLGESPERKNEAIELAVSYGFVTPYTSFLAIPENELTATTSTMMADMRARKQSILAKRSDAVALSRSQMPPGDPVLTLEAPADALRVTAYFPFGLEKDLTYDTVSKRWRVRFLVPKETRDGRYEVSVLVITRDGRAEFRTGRYVIDSEEPEFEPLIHCHDGVMDIDVRTHEPMREVRVALVSDTSQRMTLALGAPSTSGKRYIGTVKLPFGADRVRIVVTDLARNEAEEVVACGSNTEVRP